MLNASTSSIHSTALSASSPRYRSSCRHRFSSIFHVYSSSSNVCHLTRHTRSGFSMSSSCSVMPSRCGSTPSRVHRKGEHSSLTSLACPIRLPGYNSSRWTCSSPFYSSSLQLLPMKHSSTTGAPMRMRLMSSSQKLPYHRLPSRAGTLHLQWTFDLRRHPTQIPQKPV